MWGDVVRSILGANFSVVKERGQAVFGRGVCVGNEVVPQGNTNALGLKAWVVLCTEKASPAFLIMWVRPEERGEVEEAKRCLARG